MRKSKMNESQNAFVIFRIDGNTKFFGVFIKGHSLGGAEHVILDNLQTANYALAFPVSSMETVFDMFPEFQTVSENEFQAMKVCARIGV